MRRSLPKGLPASCHRPSRRRRDRPRGAHRRRGPAMIRFPFHSRTRLRVRESGPPYRVSGRRGSCRRGSLRRRRSRCRSSSSRAPRMVPRKAQPAMYWLFTRPATSASITQIFTWTRPWASHKAADRFVPVADFALGADDRFFGAERHIDFQQQQGVRVAVGVDVALERGDFVFFVLQGPLAAEVAERSSSVASRVLESEFELERGRDLARRACRRRSSGLTPIEAPNLFRLTPG